jgi:hypothetical protein
MGIAKNSGKGQRLPKTKTDRPSIIKKEHAQRKLKGSFGSPLCCLAFEISKHNFVGAGAACDLLILTFANPKRSQPSAAPTVSL